MAERLRAGVIGCGVGAAHATAFQNDPDVHLVAVCDLNPEVLGRVYERAQIAPDQVRAYADSQDMLSRERLDLVGVATPDEHHASPLLAAVEAGVRGILCEKPLASSLADADRMIAAVEQRGVKLLVDHTRNFEPAYTAVRDRLHAGDIGQLTRVVAYLGGRRAMLFRNTTHLLGAVLFYVESEPRWVMAALDHGFEDYGTTYHGQGGKDPALDPGATLIVDFANGVRALVMASKGTPQLGVELDLLGTRGRIQVGDRATRYWQAATDEGALEAREVTWPQGIQGDLGTRLAPAVAQLVEMVRHDRPGNSPPRAARGVLEIMQGALLSQASGMMPVTLPHPR